MIQSQKIQVLKFLHIGFLIIVVFIIVALHAVSGPFFDFLRMPLFLRAADPYIGEVYPFSFYLYHTALYFFLVTMVTNLAAFIFTKVQSLRILSSFVSLIGIVVTIAIGGFFVYLLVNGFTDSFLLRGSFAYLAFSSGLFALYAATFITYVRI